MHHGAVPALGIQPNAEMLSKAHPLKVRVERRLDDIRIGKQLRIPKQALIDYLSDDD